MDITIIRQGDQYGFPVTVTDDDDEPIKPEILSGFEVFFGKKRHYFKANDNLHYHSDTGELIVPVTQDETFDYRAGITVKLFVRIHYKSGDVVGLAPVFVRIGETESRVVLKNAEA